MILKKENIDLSSDIQALQRLTEAAEKQRSNYQLLRNYDSFTIYYC
jgi:molecular chaperone DnaK (HSP70)